MDIDIQGVQNVKKSRLDCKYIFIAPPSLEILEQRLRGRGTETEEKIKIRMENAVSELEFSAIEGMFDIIVVNEVLEDAFVAVVHQLQAWFPELDLYLVGKEK